MHGRVIVVTGTDTGVGKTVLTALLAAHLREEGQRVAALKPICSGSRADARTLHQALGGSLTLDQTNPWHFRAASAPTLAARLERKVVRLAEVLSHLDSIRRRFDMTVVEGAGGLLSPLGEGFNTRDLIVKMRASPVVVCPNRLGAVNQSLLVLEALPKKWRNSAVVVLVNLSQQLEVSLANLRLLSELIGKHRIVVLPKLPKRIAVHAALRIPNVRRALRALMKRLS